MRRALVTGYLSTAGDWLALDVLRTWLGELGCAHDVAPLNREASEGIVGALDPGAVEPAGYTDLVFVCGPVPPEAEAKALVDRFRAAGCRVTGLCTSLPTESAGYALDFDLLWPRDVFGFGVHPDLSLLAPVPRVPLVGVLFAPPQPEYVWRQAHTTAQLAIWRLLDAQQVAAVRIDTRLPQRRNEGRLRTPSEVVSLICRCDLVATTRLHGMVLALRCRVPALAIDPIDGGGKVTAQARLLDWPAVLSCDASAEQVAALFAWCQSQEAAQTANACALRSRVLLERLHVDFMDRWRA